MVRRGGEVGLPRGSLVWLEEVVRWGYLVVVLKVKPRPPCCQLFDGQPAVEGLLSGLMRGIGLTTDEESRCWSLLITKIK
jgi:hypothetical protein